MSGFFPRTRRKVLIALGTEKVFENFVALMTKLDKFLEFSNRVSESYFSKFRNFVKFRVSKHKK